MKGRLEEVISKALYGDDPSLYVVEYRDRDEIVRCGLSEFLKRSEKFTVIPASRIVRIKRRGKVVFERTK